MIVKNKKKKFNIENEVLNLLIFGILFILIGIYVIISDKYRIVYNNNYREIVKKQDFQKDRLYKYKIAIGILSIVLGSFSILNYIIY